MTTPETVPMALIETAEMNLDADLRGSFTATQITQLLAPVNPKRVLKDGKGHSHVSQQDITAHLIRIFGFGSFDTEVLTADVVFEEQVMKNGEPVVGKYNVCYRVMVRLTIRDPQGRRVAFYENGSTATAQNQTRGDAHDLAYKSAISLSVKRAAINLGDQYGLSLYNKGQMTALVKGTLVGQAERSSADVQEGIEQQVSLGNDEADIPLDAENPNHVTPVQSKTTEQGARVEQESTATATTGPAGWRARIAACDTVDELMAVYKDAAAEGWASPDVMSALAARKQIVLQP